MSETAVEVSLADYVWARLPFVVPMAIAVARRRPDRVTRKLARLLLQLHALLLDHLDREEALLDPAAAVLDAMHADHLAVIALIDHIRFLAGAEYRVPEGADPTERALYRELARLDEHLQAQIAVEEHYMRQDAA